MKRLLNACWKGFSPAVRPFVRRLDAHLDRHIARLNDQMAVWHAQQVRSVHEFELLGDSLVREMTRLQAQIASLEDNLHAALRAQPLTDEAYQSLPAVRPGASQAA